MTRRAPATAALLVGLLVLATGCAPVEREGPGRAALVAVDEALLDRVAAGFQRRPGVVCLDAFLASEGLPYALPGSPAVFGRTSGLTAAQRDALVRDVAREVWAAGLTTLVSLRVEVSDDAGTSDLGLLLQERFGAVDDDVLARELGPRPTPPVPPTPPDAPEVPGC